MSTAKKGSLVKGWSVYVSEDDRPKHYAALPNEDKPARHSKITLAGLEIRKYHVMSPSEAKERLLKDLAAKGKLQIA